MAITEANAASTTDHWMKIYGDSGNDAFNQIINTSDGGYAIAGYTYPFGGNISNVWLVKTDVNGTEQWNRTYGGHNMSEGNSIVQTNDGGYAIAGYTTAGDGTRVTYLVRTNADGKELWEKTFGTAPNYAMYITRLSDDSLVLAGVTYARVSTADGYLIRIDANGNETWEKIYGGVRKDEAHYVAPDNDGGFIVAGYTQSYGNQNGDYFTNGTGDAWLVKTDAAGNEQWNRSYGGDYYDDAYSVLQTIDGGYLLGGTSKSYSNDTARAYIVKTDGSGNEQWNKTYGQNASDSIYSMQFTPEGYIMAGTTYPLSEKSKAFLIKTDENGSVAWGYSYGYIDDVYGYSVIEGYNGGYMIAGSTLASVYGGVEGLILAVSDNGTAMITPENNTSSNTPAAGSTSTSTIALALIIIACLGICAVIVWKWILKK